MSVINILLNQTNRSSLLSRKFCYDRSFSNSLFVPNYKPPTPDDLIKLDSFFKTMEKVCILTGAGISTESGIPDYRSKGVGLYATSKSRPTMYQDFLDKEYIRKKYWTRNYVGWPRFSKIQPNITHKIVKYLEDIGRVSGIVTQNVDGLHTKAGSRNVIELHGSGFTVMCLNCSTKIDRKIFQDMLDRSNQSISYDDGAVRPDGDVELLNRQVDRFMLPPCNNCGGIMKPDIVFFGDNVASNVVDDVKKVVSKSDALLVLGTSLTTFSSYRIILQAFEENKPIAIVNIGETRADKYATVKVESKCGEVLTKLFPHIHAISVENHLSMS